MYTKLNSLARFTTIGTFFVDDFGLYSSSFSTGYGSVRDIGLTYAGASLLGVAKFDGLGGKPFFFYFGFFSDINL